MLTISNLIALLEGKHINATNQIFFPNGTRPRSFGSYRGYYTDLAVYNDYIDDDGNSYEYPTNETSYEYEDVFDGPSNRLTINPTVKDVLTILIGCKGYRGYKGGYFKMNSDGPLWYSRYGSSNKQIISGVKVIGGKVILNITDFDYEFI